MSHGSISANHNLWSKQLLNVSLVLSFMESESFAPKLSVSINTEAAYPNGIFINGNFVIDRCGNVSFENLKILIITIKNR